nr:MAG TPA: hypothetical protein [Caudoviricetes sp.]
MWKFFHVTQKISIVMILQRNRKKQTPKRLPHFGVFIYPLFQV